MRDTSYLNEINALTCTEKHLFAAANTGRGFVSCFDRFFSPNRLRKLYILKGGPGVGKSTLMKKAASAAERKGWHPVFYHCSSDPSSLDGVFIPETGKAVVDGTAPHTVDPKYAGAREELVALGDAWSIPFLEKQDERILELTDRKSACYRSAYRLLAAAEHADAELRTMGEECLNTEKMRGAVERLCSRHFKSGTGFLDYMYTEAYSCDGFVRFFTFEKEADFLYLVKDARSAVSAFLALLAESALRKGAEVVCGMRPLDPTTYSSLYFPRESVCVSVYDDAFARKLERAEKPYKIVNLGRFFDAERFSHCRGKYRFTEKCRTALCDAAMEELANAGEYHAALEEIYGKATDYARVEEMSERVVNACLR